VTAGYDGTVADFDPASGTVRRWGHHEHLATSIAANADGSLVVTGSADYTVGLWETAGGTRVDTLRGHEDDVEAVCFLDDGRIASAGRDHRILVHDPVGGEHLRLPDSTRDVLALAAGRDVLLSAGDDRCLRAWSLVDFSMVHEWGPFPDETDACALDPTRGLAALGCDDGTIEVIDLSAPERSLTIAAHSSGIKSVAFTHHGTVLSAAYDQRIRVHEVSTWPPGHRPSGTAADVGALAATAAHGRVRGRNIRRHRRGVGCAASALAGRWQRGRQPLPE
jgi:WD40 repeat protein